MYKLLYIGKSDKDFTHDKIYNFMGSPSSLFNTAFHTTIITEKRRITLHCQHFTYFKKNFKLVDEHQIKQLERKKKLKKLQ